MSSCAAGSTAESVVALTYEVASATPLTATELAGTKPLPVTVIGVAGAGTVADAGATAVIVGPGLVTVKVSDAETPPPGAGFDTVMARVRAGVSCAAGMTAVRVPAST